jgi:hypothetical protein
LLDHVADGLDGASERDRAARNDKVLSFGFGLEELGDLPRIGGGGYLE